MKSIIIYYSQTGNTKKIAEAISVGIKKTFGTCDIVNIRNVKPKDVLEYDLIGFGAPVWHQREPANLTSFINKLPNMSKKFCFVFCTHGVLPGLYISRTVTALQNINFNVLGWNDWYGDYFCGPQPYFTHGHPDKQAIDEAETFGLKMSEKTLNIKKGNTEILPELPSLEEYHKLYGISLIETENGVEKRKAMDQKSMPVFDKTKCKYPNCKICIKNCPVNCIDIEKDQKINYDKCESCLFCVLLCPSGALTSRTQANTDITNATKHFTELAKDLFKSKKVRRYRNLLPEKDMFKRTGLITEKHTPKLIIKKDIGIPLKKR